MARMTGQLLFLILHLLMTICVIFNILDFTFVVSAAFYATFPIVLGLWGLQILDRKIQKKDIMVCVIVGLAAVCVFANAVLTGSSLSFGYIKKLIFFSFTIIYLKVCSEADLTKKNTEVLLNLNTIIAMVFCIMFVICRERMYVLNDQVTKYLTFCYNNPNEVALTETCICFVETIRMLTSKDKRQRFFHGFLCVAMCYFILESQSRNAQMAVAAFAALVVWIWWPKRRVQVFDRRLSFFLVLLPLLFALMYILFIDNPAVNSMFSFMVSEGKKLSSRMKIWGPAVEHFKSSPLIGAYSQISEGTGASQMHNTHLDVLASYGVIVYGILIAFLNTIVGKLAKVYKTDVQSLCLAGFIGVYLLGLGEAALFSGGLVVYILMIQFLLLVRSPLFEEREMICESYLYQIISATIKKNFQKK